jgi:hypothetical protein
MNRKRRQERREIEALKPLAPDYSRRFTQGELKEYDFQGWDIRRLPYGVEKAARSGTVAGNTVEGPVECVGCKRPVWSVSPKMENLCETCDYYMRNEIWEMRAARAKRNNMKPVNPFAESEERSVLFNPFKDEE